MTERTFSIAPDGMFPGWDVVIIDSVGDEVARLPRTCRDEAELIVRACNAHDGLMEKNRELLDDNAHLMEVNDGLVDALKELLDVTNYRASRRDIEQARERGFEAIAAALAAARERLGE